jgi:translocation and assembly module TamB
VNLDIVRGRIFYSGGPLDQPTLDFLALRTINEVKAGVTVGGTLQEPVIKLYSEPAMPQVDVLGYIVIGHPISNGEQAGIASKAASMLLSAGEVGELNAKLQDRLGISAGIQADSRLTSNTMGYKPVQTNAPGQSPTSMDSTQAESMLTVGKYLTPKFYVSYGKSLSTGSNLVRMRYDISKRWQVESQSGDESGLDVYYKVEFK